MNPVSNMRTIIFLGAVLLLVVPAAAQDKPDKKLEQAIAVLRRVDQGKLNEQQQKAKANEIDEAWGVIKAVGKMGVARLKEEIRLVDQNRERDDYFKLNASALLWNIGQFDEADSIAAIWKSTPLNAQYKYAKKSQQEKAELLAAARKSAEERYQLREDDKKLTHDQLIEAAQEWKRNGRVFGAKPGIFTQLPKEGKEDNSFLFSVNKYHWVEERHILSAATAGDILLLLEVKAALCARLSEETLFEIRRLNGVIGRLGRSRYRKVIGLTEKVE